MLEGRYLKCGNIVLSAAEFMHPNSDNRTGTKLPLFIRRHWP